MDSLYIMDSLLITEVHSMTITLHCSLPAHYLPYQIVCTPVFLLTNNSVTYKNYEPMT